MARFGVTEAYVAEKLYSGLVKLYGIEKETSNCVYLEEVRKDFLDGDGNVDWDKVEARWAELKKVKVSLANKYFTPECSKKARSLAQEDQQRLLNVMMGGLANDDSGVGAYATSPEDYDRFSFFLEPLIREYHGIEGDTKQRHDWNIPVGKYLLTSINPSLKSVSMRARVARNVKGWNLPPLMSKDERIRFEDTMEKIFSSFGIDGRYYSLTPGHKCFISNEEADQMRAKHYLFNDVTTDNHLTSSGVANDWPYGRGIWLSTDKTKMIWVGEEDQLRIISIVHGYDLGAVDASLYELLSKMEKSGITFAEHPTYGVITTCPTNMRTGKRQSILGKFPNITNSGKNEKKLKETAKQFALQARGLAGEHSAMDK